MLGFKKNIALCVVTAGLLSACAEAPKKADKSIPLEESISQATAAATAGQADKAVALLKSAASSHPADKSPWLQIAQIRFDSGNYGDAITNALEALQRDPKDKLANSIVAVSGLRLSNKALADLSQQNNLTGTVKTEAQDLAKLLRENLGETVLVPPLRARAPAPVARPAPRPAAKVVRSAKPAAEEPADSNPFGALK